MRTPSPATPPRPAPGPAGPTTSSWLFPPATQGVQLDEQWSFVAKEQQHCDRADARRGDCRDHVAPDPGHRLVLGVVVGKRTEANARRLGYEVCERTDGRPLNLITSDEYPAWAAAIAADYA